MCDVVAHVMLDPPLSCCSKVNMVRHPDYTLMIWFPQNIDMLFFLLTTEFLKGLKQLKIDVCEKV